ncbi:MAG: hypothetical protein WA964_16635 [Ilumatobacter sp.]|uniref:hypothetical protein n=1 Tax=Ilumatobacter sp. TaxID=1967498 RepID=UPI003C714FF4
MTIGFTAERMTEVARLADGQCTEADRMRTVLNAMGTDLSVWAWSGAARSTLAEFIEDAGNTAAVLRVRAELASLADGSYSDSRFSHLQAELDAALAALHGGLDDGVGATGAPGETGSDVAFASLMVAIENGTIVPTTEQQQQYDMLFGDFDLSTSIMTTQGTEWTSTIPFPQPEGFDVSNAWRGGGAIEGPDGRMFPIVIPAIEVDGKWYTMDHYNHGASTVSNLGGADPGWVTTGYRTGEVRLQKPLNLLETAIVTAADFTGDIYQSGPTDDAVPGFQYNVGAAPVITAIAPGPTDVGIRPARMSATRWATERVNGRTIPVQDLNATNRANARGNAFGLLLSAAGAAEVPMNINANLDGGYEVIFEEHPDGRTRARVTTFRIEGGAGESSVSAWHMYVDDNGTLTRSPAAYLSNQDGSSVEPAGIRPTDYGFDHDWGQAMARPAIDVRGPAE